MRKSSLLAVLFFICSICFAASFNNPNTFAASPQPATASPAAGTTDILLLTCMDYRLIDDVNRYMTKEGLSGKYDYVILAGASLGPTNSKFPAWRKTFWEHLQVAINLHKIHKVMLMDHDNCGAYKVILGEDAVRTPERERKAHLAHLNTLKKQIAARYRKLEVKLLLMSLDGKVEVIH